MANNKGIETVIRRVTSVTNHLISSPTSSSPPQLISLCHTSSYQRVHGDVPSHDVVWKVVPSDDDHEGKAFTDIVYEKSVGEGIAKVVLPPFFFSFCFTLFVFYVIVNILETARLILSFVIEIVYR